MEERAKGIIIQSVQDLRGIISNDEYLFYLGMVSPPRPGVMEFFTYVEYEHYPPGTARNDLFSIWIYSWQSILWSLMGVPLRDEKLIQKVADLCGLRIVDGIPAVLSSEGMEEFPVSRYNIYTLENKRDHPVYHNDPTINKVMRDAEEMAVQEMQKKKKR